MSDGTKFAKKGLVIAIALLLVIILMAPVAQGCDYIAMAEYSALKSRYSELWREYQMLSDQVRQQRSTIGEMEGQISNINGVEVVTLDGANSAREEVDGLQQQINNKEAEIDEIGQRMEELNHEMEAIEATIITLMEFLPGCFACDTLVLMADNSLKRISDVQVGEMVLAYDVDTGQTVVAEVTATNSGEADHYYLINGNLKVTPPHPFFTAEGKWVKIPDLKVGDKVRSLQGLVEITSIERVNSGQRICNIGVGDFHNFFVSANGKDSYLVQEGS